VMIDLKNISAVRVVACFYLFFFREVGKKKKRRE